MVIFELENELKQNLDRLHQVDDVIQYSIFQTFPPIADPYTAIDMLERENKRYNDIRFLILGSFLSSTWLNYEDNKLLSALNLGLGRVTNHDQRSIIYYLNAYDFYMRSNDYKDNKRYKDQLLESVKYSKRFVYNFYRLSEISQGKDAIEYLEKCLQNVRTIYNVDQIHEMDIRERIKYDFFVNEHITIAMLTTINYEIIKDKYFDIKGIA